MATPYATAVAADAPVAWWKLNETTGTNAADSGSSPNAGTYTGTPVLNQTGLAAGDSPNVCPRFTNDALRYVAVPGLAIHAPTSFTVEALVESNGVNGNNRIVEKGADTSWALYVESGVLKFTVFGHASATIACSDMTRHHVAGTYNGATGTALLYLDGVQVGSQTSTSGTPSATTDTLRIGQKPVGTANSDGWNGKIDEVAIYSSVLTPTRIAAHAAAAALPAATLTWKGYTWDVANRAVFAPYSNGFTGDQASIDGSGFLHLLVTPRGDGSSVGAEVSSTTTGLGYGTYTCVIGSRVDNLHPNVVVGGMFPYGADAAYGHREIDVNEQSMWSGATGPCTLSQSVWMPSSATDPYAARGGYNTAGTLTTTSATSQCATMIWEPGRVTFRLYTGTSPLPANLFKESSVTAGQTVTFNIETGGTYTGPATIPVPGDERVHFNLWVCPNYSGTSDPATVTATDITLQDFTFVPAGATAAGSGSGPLGVFVDWDRGGDFTGVGDNVTLDQRGTITATYGRDQSTSLSTVTAGRGTFDLDNSTRRYSARNASSPLSGKVKPARPVLITRAVTVGLTTTTYTIFRGHSDDQPLDPDVESQRVTMNLVDYLQDLRGITIATPMYQGLRSGEAIGKILDAAGWAGGRDLDRGASVFPWWWEDGTDALDALQKVAASEGPPALLSVGVSGEIVFRDRHHRLTRAASTTPQAVFRGSEGSPEPVMGRGFSYNDGWANVVNSPSFTIGERRVGRQTPVWQSDDVFSIAASQSYVVVLQASDPFLNAVTPAAGTDFTLLSGGIASVALSRTSGQSTSITLTATGAGATISGIQLRAQPLTVARSWQVSASSAAQATANTTQSVNDYGQRGIPSGLEPVWASRYDAQSIADLYVLHRAQPLTILNVRFIASDLQQLRLSKVLSLDLSDRVTAIEPESQVNGDFYVESIQHTIDGVVSHEVLPGLEAVPALASSNVFILGTSALGGTSLLGY